jgi:general secretion pathway protein C
LPSSGGPRRQSSLTLTRQHVLSSPQGLSATSHGSSTGLGRSAIAPFPSVMNRSLALIAWALVAIIAATWALDSSDPTDDAPSHRNLGGPAAHADGGMTRPAPIEPSPVEPTVVAATSADRFKLVGVVSSGPASRVSSPSSTEGIALIAVDGKPARAFRVGATVEGDTVVKEVSEFGAILGPGGGGVAISLQVPSPSMPPMAMAPAPASRFEPAPQVSTEPPSLSPDVLRDLGSKYPPLQPQPESAAPVPVAGTPKAADGSWTR